MIEKPIGGVLFGSNYQAFLWVDRLQAQLPPDGQRREKQNYFSKLSGLLDMKLHWQHSILRLPVMIRDLRRA